MIRGRVHSDVYCAQKNGFRREKYTRNNTRKGNAVWQDLNLRQCGLRLKNHYILFSYRLLTDWNKEEILLTGPKIEFLHFSYRTILSVHSFLPIMIRLRIFSQQFLPSNPSYDLMPEILLQRLFIYLIFSVRYHKVLILIHVETALATPSIRTRGRHPCHIVLARSRGYQHNTDLYSCECPSAQKGDWQTSM